jgi:dihydroxyacetone kinase-like predicted kinase
MERGMEDVQTAEITTAVRDVSLNGLEVQEGQIIGLIDGELRVAGPDIETVAQGVLQRMGMDEMEILTFYYGETVSEPEAQSLIEQVESLYPDVEVELIEGGQPHYHYIISAE